MAKPYFTHEVHFANPERIYFVVKKKPLSFDKGFFFTGAGDEARTRYLHLGKVALYRMSYTRNGHDIY